MKLSVGLFLCSLVIVVFLTGCTSTRYHTTDSSSDYFVGIENAAQGKVVRVSVLDGTEYRARELDIASTDVSFLQADSLRMIPLTRVNYVEIRRRGLGVLEGAGIGVLAGSVAGGLIGAASYQGEDDFLFRSPAEAALGGAVAINILTIPIGGIIGFLRGHRNVYQIEGSSAPRKE
jgi:hypothetical protein